MTRPNILIIQADQHRFDCIGAYGNPDVHTPHIDSLTTDGVRYTNSFCPYPVCTPSRYSFLTSLYSRQHLGGSNHCTIPAGLPTFPKVLRANGYRTAAVGKMHFTPTYLDVGFDRMLLAEQNGPGRYEDDYHAWLRTEGLGNRIDLVDQEREFRQHAPDEYWRSFGALESDLDEAHHSTTWIGDRAMDELDRWGDGDHLLMASFIKPHHPFDPPAPWSQMYDPDSLTLLPGWTDACLPVDVDFHPGYFDNTSLTEAALRRVMAYYYATISQIDFQIGRMLELLKAKGLYDNTLVVYNSDHGEYLGFHHLLLKGNRMYDPLIKVPLIVKFPGQHRAGEVSDELVNSLDVGPTLLRWADCDAPQSWAGADLTDGIGRQVIFAESGRGREYMARTQTHKLLLTAETDQSLFFDLQSDPLELDNRFHNPACQAEIADLRERLLHWVLFEQPSPVHLDEAAPFIDGENVYLPGDAAAQAERAERVAWFAGKTRQASKR